MPRPTRNLTKINYNERFLSLGASLKQPIVFDDSDDEHLEFAPPALKRVRRRANSLIDDDDDPFPASKRRRLKPSPRLSADVVDLTSDSPSELMPRPVKTGLQSQSSSVPTLAKSATSAIATSRLKKTQRMTNPSARTRSASLTPASTATNPPVPAPEYDLPFEAEQWIDLVTTVTDKTQHAAAIRQFLATFDGLDLPRAADITKQSGPGATHWPLRFDCDRSARAAPWTAKDWRVDYEALYNGFLAAISSHAKLRLILGADNAKAFRRIRIDYPSTHKSISLADVAPGATMFLRVPRTAVYSGSQIKQLVFEAYHGQRHYYTFNHPSIVVLCDVQLLVLLMLLILLLRPSKRRTR